MTVQPLFHLIRPDDWTAAVERGEYRPPSLEDEGFVHFSFADQVEGTANLRYADVPALLLVEIDPSRLDAEVRVEDTYGSGTEFPHVYGPVPVEAAVATHRLTRAGDGTWTFTPRDGDVAVSPDR